ncbi:hypothetical protein ACQRBL_32480, partial [Bacillus sp. AF62]|uniref:hypothetical protein n=1 Tax=Bacillus sp. AF62 TaxID=3158960 RepID=UPI003D008611
DKLYRPKDLDRAHQFSFVPLFQYVPSSPLLVLSVLIQIPFGHLLIYIHFYWYTKPKLTNNKSG